MWSRIKLYAKDKMAAVGHDENSILYLLQHMQVKYHEYNLNRCGKFVSYIILTIQGYSP